MPPHRWVPGTTSEPPRLPLTLKTGNSRQRAALLQTVHSETVGLSVTGYGEGPQSEMF